MIHIGLAARLRTQYIAIEINCNNHIAIRIFHARIFTLNIRKLVYIALCTASGNHISLHIAIWGFIAITITILQLITSVIAILLLFAMFIVIFHLTVLQFFLYIIYVL